MTTRIHRLWQQGKGQPKVFLPNFWMKLVEVDRKLPPNMVKFEIPMQMTRVDVREYLTKIYNLPVREVRIGIEMGKLIRNAFVKEFNNKLYAGRFFQPVSKEDDKKYAYVVLKKDVRFKFPNLFPLDVQEKQKEAYEKAIETAKQKKEEDEKKLIEKKRIPDSQGDKVGVSSWF